MKGVTMFASRCTKKQPHKTHVLSTCGRTAISLVEEEREKGNITLAQADALRKYLSSVYLATYLQGSIEPFLEHFTMRTQRRLVIKSGDLMEFVVRWAEE
jgi:hypothetical protein